MKFITVIHTQLSLGSSHNHEPLSSSQAKVQTQDCHGHKQSQTQSLCRQNRRNSAQLYTAANSIGIATATQTNFVFHQFLRTKFRNIKHSYHYPVRRHNYIITGVLFSNANVLLIDVVSCNEILKAVFRPGSTTNNTGCYMHNTHAQ